MTKKTVLAALAACLISATAVAATPDRAVGRLLDSLDFPYEVDEDGDYKMVFDAGDDRTQLVFVRSSVEKFGSHHVREIWSPAYRSATSSAVCRSVTMNGVLFSSASARRRSLDTNWSRE